jgi:ABC-type lipoprotein release transport system permease subunit
MRSGITRRWLRGSLLITVLLVLLVEVMFLYSATRSYYNGVQQTMYRRFSSITGQLKMYTGETSQKTAASRSVALRRMVEQFSDKDKYEFMLLDSYGGEELGKTIGGDILEGKKSYLMVTAMSRADEEQREVLRHTYKDAALAPAEKIARVRAVFDALDVPRLTEQQISLRFDRALATLDGLNVPDARKEPLREYARSLMGRRK